MKKQTKAWSFLLSATTAILIGGGCQEIQLDESSSLQPELEYKLVNGTLHFPSIEDYDNLFKKTELLQIPGFQSLAKSLPSPLDSDSKNLRFTNEELGILKDLEGSQILEILDSDQMVIIGENLFHLDFFNRVVAVTSNLQLRQDLIQKRYNDPSVRLFSFDDDVLDLVISGSESTVPNLNDFSNANSGKTDSSQRLSSVGQNCDWNTCKLEDVQPGTSGTTSYRLQAEHKYIALGIYFELFSKADHSRTGGLGWVSQGTQMIIFWDFWFISRKNNPTFRLPNTGDFTGYTDSKKILYYRENRSLEAFRLDTNFNIDIGGDHGNGFSPSWNFDLFTISKESWRE